MSDHIRHTYLGRVGGVLHCLNELAVMMPIVALKTQFLRYLCVQDYV